MAIRAFNLLDISNAHLLSFQPPTKGGFFLFFLPLNPMELLTKHPRKILPPIGGQEGRSELMAYVKLFTPWTNWTWYIAEYNPDTGECFGYVEGLEKELGYFDLNELKGIKGPAKLRIERDRLFEPATINSIKKK